MYIFWLTRTQNLSIIMQLLVIAMQILVIVIQILVIFKCKKRKISLQHIDRFCFPTEEKSGHTPGFLHESASAMKPSLQPQIGRGIIMLTFSFSLWNKQKFSVCFIIKRKLSIRSYSINLEMKQISISLREISAQEWHV